MLRSNASRPKIGLPGRIATGFESGNPQNRSLGLILKLSRIESGRHPAPKPDFQPGNTFAQHRILFYMVYYREVSVDRDTATRTLTLKQAQGVRRPCRKPKENEKKRSETQANPGTLPRRKRFLYVSMPLPYGLTGYLRAIWPEFWDAFLKSGRPRGPRKAFQNVEGFAPHF